MKKLLFIIILIFSNSIFATSFAERPEIQKFIQLMNNKHAFDKKQLNNLFAKFNTSEEVLKKMDNPYEALPWNKYRDSIITTQRIKDGIDFFYRHKETLLSAEKKFGIPAEIIVSIIGVETSYGKIMGQHPVLQTLATLAFDYPRRSKFFLSELEQYLLLTREQKLSADKIKGSYTGAIGIAQFIPSSYRSYGIDFADAGNIDLNNIDTAIGSVANYFKAYGWQKGQPIVYKAIVKGKKYKHLHLKDKKNPKPTLQLATLNEHGIYLHKRYSINPQMMVSFMELENGENNEFWIGLHNFYVITRYNRSTNYAMAVYELSRKIAKGITKGKQNL